MDKIPELETLRRRAVRSAVPSKDLAASAGVSKRTVEYLRAGAIDDMRLSVFVAIRRALKESRK